MGADQRQAEDVEGVCAVWKREQDVCWDAVSSLHRSLGTYSGWFESEADCIGLRFVRCT
jgi:hypothetical protein